MNNRTHSMTTLPTDVWAMIIFSILVFFGVAIWALIYTLRQEERKMELLRTEGDLDSYGPRALQDLRRWIDTHGDDPDVDSAREAYDDSVETLQTTNRHFYDWSAADIQRLDTN